MTYLEKCIISEVKRGTGAMHNPVRIITQVWTCNGKLIAENDPMGPEWDDAKEAWIIDRGFREISKGTSADQERRYATKEM